VVASSTSTQRLLDELQSLARLEVFDPGVYLARLDEELGTAATIAELEATDAALREALASIDALAQRAMRIRLDHALAADSSIPVPTRKVFAGTVVAYADDLERLRTRARDISVRAAPASADAVAAVVVDAARATLELRAELGHGVLALARARAESALPLSQAAARDRHADDAVRMRWSAIRRDLEAIVDRPTRIAEAALADRLAALPPLLDEPEPERELTRGELLELD